MRDVDQFRFVYTYVSLIVHSDVFQTFNLQWKYCYFFKALYLCALFMKNFVGKVKKKFSEMQKYDSQTKKNEFLV